MAPISLALRLPCALCAGNALRITIGRLRSVLAPAFFLTVLVLAMGGCTERTPTPSDAASLAASSEAAPQQAPTSQQPLFTEVASSLGVKFVHDPGSSDNPYFMPRSVGSGAAWLDFDDDGRLDLYLLQNGGDKAKAANCLYHQDASGNFVDVSAGSGLDIHGQGMGVAVGDMNNDGKVDVLVTEFGRTRLFLNQSAGATPKFVDVTEDSGITNTMWATSSCFVDYDRDGWLDLVVVNYLDYDPSRWCADGSGRHDFCGPDNFSGRPTKLYRNLGRAARPGDTAGDGNLFEDVSVAAGLAATPGPGLGVFCADFNGDRWPDIFIANDGKPNHLWINKQDGTFVEEGLFAGLATNAMGKAEANMGVAIGDVDGNGLFDLFVTHLTSETHTLWQQESRGQFRDRTVSAGITTAWRGTGFGTVMADFNNDGAIDLSIANGRVIRGRKPKDLVPGMDPFWAIYCERNQLLVNDGRGHFVDASQDNAPFCAQAAVSRGLACADFDNDGALDLLVTRIGAAVGLYRNSAPKRGHWLTVRAIDPALHRDAYGAEIVLHSPKRRLMSWINPGYSYLCSNDPRAHFGLGDEDSFDRIDVVWPDGVEESFAGGQADRFVVLSRGGGKTKKVAEQVMP